MPSFDLAIGPSGERSGFGAVLMAPRTTLLDGVGGFLESTGLVDSHHGGMSIGGMALRRSTVHCTVVVRLVVTSMPPIDLEDWPLLLVEAWLVGRQSRCGVGSVVPVCVND